MIRNKVIQGKVGVPPRWTKKGSEVEMNVKRRCTDAPVRRCEMLVVA